MQHPFSPSSLRGKRVVYLARVFYEHQGQIDTTEGLLELGFPNGALLFESDADGEQLRVQEGVWKDPFGQVLSDENKRYVDENGKWTRMDCSQSENYSSVVDEVISDACYLANEFGRIAGVRISTSSCSLWFVVQGDESRVYWAQPIGYSEVSWEL